VAKDSNIISISGTILEVYPNGYDVELENKTKMRCVLSGNLKKRHLRLIRGDNVRVEISPYDLTRGVVVEMFRP